MFDDPAGQGADSPVHPSLMASSHADGQYGFLEQTHDRQLRLGPPPEARSRAAAKKSDSKRKRDAITKL